MEVKVPGGCSLTQKNRTGPKEPSPYYPGSIPNGLKPIPFMLPLFQFPFQFTHFFGKLIPGQGIPGTSRFVQQDNFNDTKGHNLFYFEQCFSVTLIGQFNCPIDEYNECLTLDTLCSQKDHVTL